ncbi:hypothetical protein EMIT043CA1_50170 [Pseudomonas brassicacearum]
MIRTALVTGTLIGRVRYLCLPRLMEELGQGRDDAQRRDMHELLHARYGNRPLVTGQRN